MKFTSHKIAMISASIAGLLLLSFLIWPFYVVPTGSRGVVTQMGKIIGVEGEGLTVLPPWQKLTTFSVRAETVDTKRSEGSTADTQPVYVDLTVRYNVKTDRVSEVYEKYSHTGDLNSYVETATKEVFKAVTSRYTAPDLIAQRSKVGTDVFTALQKKVELYGANIINIDMTQFSFSDEYMKAINDKVTQEQLRLVAENKLKTVEAEQKQKVAIAEAEAKSSVIHAEANARSIKLQAEALKDNSGLIELKKVEVEMARVEKWNGVLPQYTGQVTPFMNIGK